MIKMKRSQLKALIKECLVEILSEDVLINRALAGTVNEARQQQRRALPAPSQHELINPMDDGQMMLRQEALMQRSQLQRQTNTMNRQQSQGTDLMMLAGLESPVQHGPGGRQNRSDTGVMNPSDYIRLAQERPRGYNPMLDVPVAGTNRQPQRQQYVPQHQPQQQQYAAPSVPRREERDIPEFSTDALRMIFNDPTTHHTLHEQAAKGHVYNGRVDDSLNGGGAGAVAGDRFDLAVAQHQPDELFPDAALRWANLAF